MGFVFRILKSLDFQPRMGLVTRTMAAAMGDLLHFCILFMSPPPLPTIPHTRPPTVLPLTPSWLRFVYLGYAIVGHFLFGPPPLLLFSLPLTLLYCFQHATTCFYSPRLVPHVPRSREPCWDSTLRSVESLGMPPPCRAIMAPTPPCRAPCRASYRSLAPPPPPAQRAPRAWGGGAQGTSMRGCRRWASPARRAAPAPSSPLLNTARPAPHAAVRARRLFIFLLSLDCTQFYPAMNHAVRLIPACAHRPAQL
jgi:hypothetical protein